MFDSGCSNNPWNCGPFEDLSRYARSESAEFIHVFCLSLLCIYTLKMCQKVKNTGRYQIMDETSFEYNLPSSHLVDGINVEVT